MKLTAYVDLAQIARLAVASLAVAWALLVANPMQANSTEALVYGRYLGPNGETSSVCKKNSNGWPPGKYTILMAPVSRDKIYGPIAITLEVIPTNDPNKMKNHLRGDEVLDSGFSQPIPLVDLKDYLSPWLSANASSRDLLNLICDSEGIKKSSNTFDPELWRIGALISVGEDAARYFNIIRHGLGAPQTVQTPNEFGAWLIDGTEPVFGIDRSVIKQKSEITNLLERLSVDVSSIILDENNKKLNNNENINNSEKNNNGLQNLRNNDEKENSNGEKETKNTAIILSIIFFIVVIFASVLFYIINNRKIMENKNPNFVQIGHSVLHSETSESVMSGVSVSEDGEYKHMYRRVEVLEAKLHDLYSKIEPLLVHIEEVNNAQRVLRDRVAVLENSSMDVTALWAEIKERKQLSVPEKVPESRVPAAPRTTVQRTSRQLTKPNLLEGDKNQFAEIVSKLGLSREVGLALESVTDDNALLDWLTRQLLTTGQAWDRYERIGVEMTRLSRRWLLILPELGSMMDENLHEPVQYHAQGGRAQRILEVVRPGLIGPDQTVRLKAKVNITH